MADKAKIAETAEIQKPNTEIKDFIKEANTVFEDAGAAYVLTEHKGIPYYIPSGNRFLDKLISGKITGGGYPGGRLIEIFGAPSEGKTTLGVHALVGMQKMGGISILFDTESAIAPERCVSQGINPDELIIVKANTVEAVFEKLEKLTDLLVSKKKRGLILWDSVAGTTTDVEDKADYGQLGMSIHARLMSQSLRKIVYQLEKSEVTLIMINQAKANFGDEWNPATLGGDAPRFHSSVRLWVRRAGDILVPEIRNGKEFNKAVGIRSSVKTVKNKITSPLRTSYVNIFHKTGLSEESSVLDFLKEQSIVKTAGAWSSMTVPHKDGTSEDIKFYQKDFIEKLRTVPDLKEYTDSLIDRYDLIDNVMIETNTVKELK